MYLNTLACCNNGCLGFVITVLECNIMYKQYYFWNELTDGYIETSVNKNCLIKGYLREIYNRKMVETTKI